MSDASRRGRDRWEFRLECLEGRDLLSVVGGLAKPAHSHPQPHGGISAEVYRTVFAGPSTPLTTVTGRVSGTAATDGLFGGTPLGYSSFSGHGSARPLGDVLFGTAFLATRSTTTANALDISNGLGQFITLHGGNQLKVIFTGTAKAGTAGREQVTLQGTVASGNGRFDGATGTFAAFGTFTPGPSGRFALNFTVTFNPPR
jgi:hypothetical protein